MRHPRAFKRNSLAVGALAVVCVAALAAVTIGEAPEEKPATDWPQWRGPNLNGISAETGWLTKWPGKGPKQLWKVNVGAGYSSVAVSKGRLYTMGNRKNTDIVWCLDAATGKELWKQSYPCRNVEHGGPRATPTLDGDVVYTISQRGDVCCFKAADGEKVWSKNLARELKARLPQWGFAGSALVEGKLLIVNIGTAGAALDKATGKVVWQTGRGASGYATPVAFDMDARRCMLVFGAKALFCVDAKTGKRAWSVPWKTDYDVNAADPIVVGGKIFISSGYGTGCALLEVKDGKPEVLWRNRAMKNQFSTCVLLKGHLYGSDGNVQRGSTTLKCMDFATGKVKWTHRGLKMTSLMAADGKLLVYSEQGALIVADASPEGFKPISRTQALTGRCWTMPVLAAGRIYCRNNNRGFLVCLDVSGG